MCEPWGSFIVNENGKIFARDGILSHSALEGELRYLTLKENIEESISSFFSPKQSPRDSIPTLTHNHPDRIYKPEYDWLHRQVRDFGRHDLEEVPGSRACAAVDRYVQKNFSDASRFLGWLERGNFLPNYGYSYVKLFRPEKMIEKKAGREFSKGCPHVDKIVFHSFGSRFDRFRKMSAYCPVCRRRECITLSDQTIRLRRAQDGCQVDEQKIFLINLLREARWIHKPAQMRESINLGEFVDLWKNEKNRIPAWVN